MNPTEGELRALLEANGYKVLRSGWPDFLAIPPDGGQSIAVEVKSGSDTVRKHQQAMHEALEAAGIPVLTVRPEPKRVARVKSAKPQRVKNLTAVALGQKRWDGISPEARSTAARKAVAARWNKKSA